jgi:phosphodiesterase/alkaline phosphatase D-like protein
MGNLIGSASASITISTGSLPEPPPPAPEPSLGTITATAVSQTSINVVWSTTNNPTTVSVSGDGITTRNTASGDINATGLQPNTSYTYTLVCSNEANASNPDTVTATARTLLPAPTLTITATTLTSTTARVVWSTTNATEATITGTNLDSTDLSGNVIVTGLTRNTIYRWSGIASNDDGNTGTVQSNSITTLNVIGGVWTGSTFAVPTVRVWTGSTWAVKEAKVWTGTTWKVWV